MEKENTVVSNFVDFASGRHAKEEPDNILMFTDAGMSMKYFRMDSRKKVEFIIDNFRTFPDQLDAMTDLVKVNIICEQEYRHNRNSDNIRVQTSGTSDPTASIAIRNVMLDDAICNNDVSEVIKDRRMAAAYNRALDGIENMRRDYYIVGAYIRLLTPIEKHILEDYMDSRTGMNRVSEISAKYEYTDSRSIYRRVRAIKLRIADEAAPGLDRKYGEMTA